jgi:hypothetical protein
VLVGLLPTLRATHTRVWILNLITRSEVFADVCSKVSEKFIKTLVYFQTFMKPSVKPPARWITNTYFNSKFAENTDGFSYDPF